MKYNHVIQECKLIGRIPIKDFDKERFEEQINSADCKKAFKVIFEEIYKSYDISPTDNPISIDKIRSCYVEDKDECIVYLSVYVCIENISYTMETMQVGDNDSCYYEDVYSFEKLPKIEYHSEYEFEVGDAFKDLFPYVPFKGIDFNYPYVKEN